MIGLGVAKVARYPRTPPARTPNQITARKTRIASARSVSRWAVGGSTPGISVVQLATKINANSVPTKARYGAGSSSHRVAYLAVHRLDDQLENGLRNRRRQSRAPHDERASCDQYRHDGPGREHGLGDRHGADMEDGDAGER